MKFMTFIIIFFLFISCESMHNLNQEKFINSYVEKNPNNNVRNVLFEKIETNAKKRMKDYTAQIYRSYRVDPLIIFNKSYNKLFTTVNTKSLISEKGSSDLVQALYGVKISGEWHIYLGANCIALRDGYKYDRYEPFTWEELSYVAHENFFGKYIDIDRKGNLKVDVDKIEKQVDPWVIAGTSVPQEGTDEERFKIITEYEYSRTLSDKEYEDLLEEVNNPKPKKKTYIDKITWWDKLWGAEELIFDSKEWKEYIKNKNTSHESK